MSNILFGNGININFLGSQFTSKSIIIRAITTINNKKNPKEAYTKEILDWFKLLHLEYENTRNGTNDQYAYASFDKTALADFKQRYKSIINPKIYDIGFEDYFLLHDIFCHKNNIQNPEMFNFRELLKRMFLDSIYFKGKLLNVKENYPNGLISYMNNFNMLFTTNYDNNIESKCNKKVHYLHGAFHILNDVYNPNSFRNQLSDTNGESFSYAQKHPYLFSTALSTYTGDLKQSMMKQNAQANSCIQKMAEGYKSDPKIKEKVDKWKNDNNELLRNFYESIKLKVDDENYTFSENYSLDEFLNINDELTIIGLSPFNDTHIFKMINDNQNLPQIIYYFYDNSEIQNVERLLCGKSIKFRGVKDFWKLI